MKTQLDMYAEIEKAEKKFTFNNIDGTLTDAADYARAIADIARQASEDARFVKTGLFAIKKLSRTLEDLIDDIDGIQTGARMHIANALSEPEAEEGELL